MPRGASATGCSRADGVAEVGTRFPLDLVSLIRSRLRGWWRFQWRHGLIVSRFSARLVPLRTAGIMSRLLARLVPLRTAGIVSRLLARVFPLRPPGIVSRLLPLLCA